MSAAKQRDNSVPPELAPHCFQPGQSGNPSGRPKGAVSLVHLLRAKLAEVPEGQRKTYAQGIVDSTIKDALAGDSAARKLVWSYIEGDPKQHIDVTTNGESLNNDHSDALAEYAPQAAEVASAYLAGIADGQRPGVPVCDGAGEPVHTAQAAP